MSGGNAGAGLLLLCSSVAIAPAAFAQSALPGASPDGIVPAAALAQIWGADRSFTATARVTLTETNSLRSTTMMMDYAVRQGSVRTDLDMSRVKGVDMAADAMATMTTMGLARMTVLHRAEENTTYRIFPDLEAYCESKGPATTTDGAPTVEKTKIARESVGAHACVKYAVVLIEADGGRVEATVWEAADLDGFPVQTKFTKGSVTTVLRFMDIEATGPVQTMFDPPQGFKRFDSFERLMINSLANDGKRKKEPSR